MQVVLRRWRTLRVAWQWAPNVFSHRHRWAVGMTVIALAGSWTQRTRVIPTFGPSIVWKTRMKLRELLFYPYSHSNDFSRGPSNLNKSWKVRSLNPTTFSRNFSFLSIFYTNLCSDINNSTHQRSSAATIIERYESVWDLLTSTDPKCLKQKKQIKQIRNLANKFLICRFKCVLPFSLESPTCHLAR